MPSAARRLKTAIGYLLATAFGIWVAWAGQRWLDRHPELDPTTWPGSLRPIAEWSGWASLPVVLLFVVGLGR